MSKLLILYTMKGCPYCEMIKDNLNENLISFHERDIDEYEEEFNLFTEVSGSEYVPSFMIIENVGGDEHKSHLFVPEINFNTIDEATEIIKEFYIKK